MGWCTYRCYIIAVNNWLLLFTLLRGTLVNRTYGEDKNLYIHLFLLTIFGPIYYRPP